MKVGHGRPYVQLKKVWVGGKCVGGQLGKLVAVEIPASTSSNKNKKEAEALEQMLVCIALSR